MSVPIFVAARRRSECGAILSAQAVVEKIWAVSFFLEKRTEQLQA